MKLYAKPSFHLQYQFDRSILMVRGDTMKIAAYQFAVTNNLDQNMKQIQKALLQASHMGVKLLVFPECALTGYPPRDLKNSSSVSFHELASAFQKLEKLSADYAIHLIVGTVIQENKSCYNSAALFSPNQKPAFYHKRALWGWDQDNFCMGTEKGVFKIEGWSIGIPYML